LNGKYKATPAAKAKAAAYNLKWRVENKDKVRQHSLRRNEKRRARGNYRSEEQREKERKWARTPEQERARYYANREKILATKRASYYRNHEKHLARFKARDARKASQSTVRQSPDEVYRLISKSVPNGLSRYDRDDVVAAMCLAVLEGKLLVKNIKTAVTKYLAAHNREYDGFKTLSLDAEIPGTKKRYIDNVAADQEHF
jgi:hypothetical protein